MLALSRVHSMQIAPRHGQKLLKLCMTSVMTHVEAKTLPMRQPGTIIYASPLLMFYS